ncbi:MAG TPA: hypothetical protein VKT71_05755 [Candidatus Acidoferrales bacterium]|nr:hypothetical protein [Candidatus Acidoferrales bacterium]
MNPLETILSWSTLSFELILCGFVFIRRVDRVLPFFTAYAYALLGSTIGVWLTYECFGFDSNAAYFAYWISVLVNAAARSLAIVELCRYGLQAYRGIWALVWRFLTGLSVVLLAHAAVDAWGQPRGLAIYGATLDRDLALASIAVLAALFLVRYHYSLDVNPTQRLIAAGICLICAVDVIGNTIIRKLFTGYLFSWFLSSQEAQASWPSVRPQFMHVADIWSAVHLFFFMLSMGIWSFALRKPLLEQSERPILLPAGIYQELSPAINLRLSAFNDRLVELLKP